MLGVQTELKLTDGICGKDHVQGQNTSSLPFTVAGVSKLWVAGEIETTVCLRMALEQRVVKKKPNMLQKPYVAHKA